MLGPFDAAADRNDALRLREIDGLPRFLKRRLGLLTDRGRIDRRIDRAHRRGGRARRRLVGAKGADLHRDEPRRLAERTDVGRQLALEHRPREHRATAVALDGRAVGDERAIEARGQRRREVAGLVGVRQHDPRRRDRRHRRGVRLDPAVGRVERKVRRRQRDDLGDGGRGKLCGRIA